MKRFQSGYGDPDGDPLTAGEFGLVTRDLARSTGAAQVLLALRDDVDGSLEVVSSWSHGDSANLPHRPSAGGFLARVLESGHAAAEPIHSFGVGYAVGAPIGGPGDTVGALCAAFPSK